MSTVILQTEVQTRIDALVYSSGTLQAKEVLQESVDILGLDLDLTNIIAVHASMTSAIATGTPAKDITALSAASVNLGVTNKPSSPLRLLMPKFICSYVNLNIIGSTTRRADDFQFLEYIISGAISAGYDTTQLSHSADTSEQTLVDTGMGNSGILTQIVSPRLSGYGTMTITVTIDADEVYTFIGTLPTANDSVLCVGDFIPVEASDLAGGGTVTSTAGSGYSDLAIKDYTMLTPEDSVSRGLPVGLVFRDSLKITIQGSTNLTATSSTNKAAAAWLNYIPVGVL